MHLVEHYDHAGVPVCIHYDVDGDRLSPTDTVGVDRFAGAPYFYVVAEGTAFEDSCGGFLGLEYAREEADRAAECAAAQLHDEEIARGHWAARDVITVSGSPEP